MDRYKSKVDVLVRNITDRISAALRIKNEKDIQNIRLFLEKLCESRSNNSDTFISTLIDFIKNVKIYTEDEKEILQKKIYKKMKPFETLLHQEIVLCDLNKTGLITFYDLRSMLSRLEIRLKDKYTEFLIFIMKSVIKEDNYLSNLNYEVFYKH